MSSEAGPLNGLGLGLNMLSLILIVVVVIVSVNCRIKAKSSTYQFNYCGITFVKEIFVFYNLKKKNYDILHFERRYVNVSWL